MKNFLSFFIALFLSAVLLQAEQQDPLSSDPKVKKPITIVAAENVYGNIAQQIGGPSVQVKSILDNPNQDPHEFQPDSATVMAIADADIIIYNGLGYDGWIERILQSQKNKKQRLINVAHLVRAHAGDNPHLWYNPTTMIVVAKELSVLLEKPSAEKAFQTSMQPLFEKMATLKKNYQGTKITATEPLFTPMAQALGFEMLNEGYQLAIMNGTEPSFQQTVDFENSLKNKTVRVLIYNSQVVEPSTKRIQAIAQHHGIPVVGVTEMQPASEKNYQTWMLNQLSQVEEALNLKTAMDHPKLAQYAQP